MKRRKNYAIVFGVVFLFLVLSMSFTSAVTSPQDSNQNVFQVVSHWFSDLGSKFTGKVIDAPSATGNVIAGAPNLQQCVDCAAPPFGCSYSGGSCTTCGTLVDSATGGPCTGGDIGIMVPEDNPFPSQIGDYKLQSPNNESFCDKSVCLDRMSLEYLNSENSSIIMFIDKISSGEEDYFKFFKSLSLEKNFQGISNLFGIQMEYMGKPKIGQLFWGEKGNQFLIAQYYKRIPIQGGFSSEVVDANANNSVAQWFLGKYPPIPLSNLTSSTCSVDSLTGLTKCNLDQGNSLEAVIQNMTYKISLIAASDQKATFVVNGESFSMSEGTSHVFANLNLYLDSLVIQDFAGGIGQVVFTLSPATKTLPTFDVILNNPTLFPSLGLSTKPEHTIVEFADFQDPYAALASAIPNWTENYSTNYEDLIGLSKKIRQLANEGKIRLVYAPMSFLGQESIDAAQAALCANEQGKFWEMHDLLFSIQPQDKQNVGAYNRARLKLMVKKRSTLDPNKFDSCFDNNETLADVQKAAEISSNFASGSPTFYVDGKQVSSSWSVISGLINGTPATHIRSSCTNLNADALNCTLYVENTPFFEALVVKKITPKDATLLILNKDKVTLGIGESYTFNVTQDNKKIEYKILLKDIFYSSQREDRLNSSSGLTLTGYLTVESGRGSEGSSGRGLNDGFNENINKGVKTIYGTSSVPGLMGEVVAGDSYIQLEISRKLVGTSTNVSSQSDCTSGCYSDGTCYPIGYRVNGTFCSSDKNFTTQLSSNLACQNSFECSSNVCANNQCVSEGLIQKILNWFSRLFGSRA